MPGTEAPATTPESDIQQPTSEPTPAAEDTTSTAPADSEGDETAPEGEISDDLLSRIELLSDASGAAEDAESEEEPEGGEEPPAQPQAAETKQPAAVGSFDSAAFTEAFVDQIGESAKPVADMITSAIAGLEARLDKALDENKKLRGEIEPVSKKVKGWEEVEARRVAAEQAETAKTVHSWFDKQAEFADRYGKGDPAKHSQTQKNWRSAVFNKATSLLRDATREGIPLSVDEALEAAQYLKFKGRPTRVGAVEAVRSSVKRAARNHSPDPVRGGGNKNDAPETPEQERQRKIEAVRRIEARARNGNRN